MNEAANFRDCARRFAISANSVPQFGGDVIAV
jgi:hypothetical protein